MPVEEACKCALFQIDVRLLNHDAVKGDDLFSEYRNVA